MRRAGSRRLRWLYNTLIGHRRRSETRSVDAGCMPIPNPALLFLLPLEALKLPYMVVGSFACIAYGMVRDTRDVDIVLTMTVQDSSRVAAAYPLEEFYCPYPETLVAEASRTRSGHFNVIHHDTGFRADFYLAASDPLDRWAFQHRRRFPVDGEPIWVAPPEHVIVNKLEFFREGGSDKHLRDIRIMLKFTEVDAPLLEAEIARRGLGESWRQCKPQTR